MTVLNCFPIDVDGRAGSPHFVESPLLERPAIAAWATKHVRGWWTLRRLGTSYAGHQLWEVTRPCVKFDTSGKRYGQRQSIRPKRWLKYTLRWRVVSTLKRVKVQPPPKGTLGLR